MISNSHYCSKSDFKINVKCKSLLTLYQRHVKIISRLKSNYHSLILASVRLLYAYIVLSLLSYNKFEIHCFKLTCNYHLSQINIQMGENCIMFCATHHSQCINSIQFIARRSYAFISITHRNCVNYYSTMQNNQYSIIEKGILNSEYCSTCVYV